MKNVSSQPTSEEQTYYGRGMVQVLCAPKLDEKKQGQTVYKTAIQIKRLYEYRQNDEGSEKGRDKESMLV